MLRNLSRFICLSCFGLLVVPSGLAMSQEPSPSPAPQAPADPPAQPATEPPATQAPMVDPVAPTEKRLEAIE